MEFFKGFFIAAAMSLPFWLVLAYIYHVSVN